MEARADASRRHDELEAEMGRLVREWADLGRASEAAKRDVVRAILEVSPRSLPDDEEWFNGIGPHWTARLDGRLLCLVRKDSGSPRDLNEVVEAVTLTVIDLDAIGGAR